MNRNELINKLKEWLREDGIKFFREIKCKYGKINAVYSEGGFPHAVHFVEGMQVRNFLREHVDWDAHKLDNEWIGLIEEAISE